MKNRYIDLIEQTFDFPQKEFSLTEDRLLFHDIDLSALIGTYGTPLKFSYLPKISENINQAKQWFTEAMKAHHYEGKYNYCYCTKSSHFKFVLDEVLKNEVHIETSSAIDLDIVKNLLENKQLHQDSYILCNGFKRASYIDNISDLINSGYRNCIPIIDNYEELDLLTERIDNPIQIGIRIASEEDPKFEFYTSRLGIGYKNIIPYYKNQIKNNDKVELKMLHFFINTGIQDQSYYWNELMKCMKVYVELKKICPSLEYLNIGGGFPIKTSLGFEYDYAYMAYEIIGQIKSACTLSQVDEPHIFTEFGSFTVGESGGAIYQVLYQKQQNDREKWNMINSSFITTLPDSWAINKRYVMLPINRWRDEYERVLLGGTTCDSDDYYNSEQHVNAIYLPVFNKNKPLFIGFFNTGAYQESIGGFGGLHHCLIPQPRHILINKDHEGNLTHEIFTEQQTAEDFLSLLGYQ